jgi:hypothetical protein
MFWTPVSTELADASHQLTRVLDIPDKDGVDPKGWKVYEIRNWGLVSGLDTEPVVATMHDGTRTSCLPNSGDLSSGELDTRLNAWECATDALWMDPTTFNRPVVSSGPKSWQRVDLKPQHLTTVTTPTAPNSSAPPDRELHATGPSMLAPLINTPIRHITPTTVSNVRETVDSISFHVDEIGKPVVVRTSYFPNWQVHGADGIYRVAPNLMVVVPRQHDVRLAYGLTSADWLGRIGTLVGVVLLVLMIWRWPTVPLAWTADAHNDRDDDGWDDDLDDGDDTDTHVIGVVPDAPPPEEPPDAPPPPVPLWEPDAEPALVDADDRDGADDVEITGSVPPGPVT